MTGGQKLTVDFLHKDTEKDDALTGQRGTEAGSAVSSAGATLLWSLGRPHKQRLQGEAANWFSNTEFIK